MRGRLKLMYFSGFRSKIRRPQKTQKPPQPLRGNARRSKSASLVKKSIRLSLHAIASLKLRNWPSKKKRNLNGSRKKRRPDKSNNRKN